LPTSPLSPHPLTVTFRVEGEQDRRASPATFPVCL
jgi:hypothetical protein